MLHDELEIEFLVIEPEKLWKTAFQLDTLPMPLMSETFNSSLNSHSYF